MRPISIAARRHAERLAQRHADRRGDLRHDLFLRVFQGLPDRGDLAAWASGPRSDRPRRTARS